MPFTSETAAAAGKKSSREGKTNKTTKEIREILRNIVSNKSEDLEKWIEEVAKDNPAKACELIVQLAKFNVPILKSVEMTGDGAGLAEIKPILISFKDADN